MISRKYGWGSLCAFSSRQHVIFSLYFSVSVCAHCVLTGGSGSGNATSNALRIYFHVSHPPSHLIVFLVAPAFKPTYVNVFSGFSLPDLRPCYISCIDHHFVTNNCADNGYLLKENAGHTEGQQKVKSLQNGKGE